MKFGADMNTARRLLEKAREIDLEAIGVRCANPPGHSFRHPFSFSFHCGSGQMTSKAFVDAIQNARMIMNYGNKLGFTMNLLDIGGGFPGNTGTEDYFAEIATAVNAALDEHFPDDNTVRIIAEPGRYYVASAYSLATNVIASREMLDSGSFDCLTRSIQFSSPCRNRRNEVHVLHQ